MIVRNEAHIVEECLASIVAHIDRFVIVDTGSTDGTVTVVRRFFLGAGVSGEIHSRPWHDFARNRSEALELCRGVADYILVMDADDRLVGDPDLSVLRADAYLLRIGTDFRYWRRQLFRDGLPWRYAGVVHEYPVCREPHSEQRLQGDYHIESRRLGARGRDAGIYRRDARLLQAELERRPDDPRTVFYLAQSLRDAGDAGGALRWYRRRVEMGGWPEEVFFSRLQIGHCLARLGAAPEQIVSAYLEAHDSRPSRAEPLYELARHYREREQWPLAYLFAERAAAIPDPVEDTLFVAADVHRWRACEEWALAAYYTGRYAESFGLWSRLLASDAVPERYRDQIERNRSFAVPHLLDDAVDYPADIVAALCAPRPDAARITMTITSARRPLLFERTVNSFLHCCSDLGRIGRWICVDNGSSAPDRAWMRERYPFFEFIETDPRRERHADSMNRLLEMVDSPWWLHLEDDWQFFAVLPYVGQALDILEDDPRIGQVAFNRNYAETLDDCRIVGGEIRRTAGAGLRYRHHVHLDRDGPDWKRHLANLPSGATSNAWWPHFTLRPSLIRTDAARGVGRFEPGGGHFELDFARRWSRAGLCTAFLDGIHCLHIGRLTSQGPGQGPPSAYELLGDGRHPAHPERDRESSVDSDGRFDARTAPAAGRPAGS
jgi:hypothetical protein